MSLFFSHSRWRLQISLIVMTVPSDLQIEICYLLPPTVQRLRTKVFVINRIIAFKKVCSVYFEPMSMPFAFAYDVDPPLRYSCEL